MSKVCPNQREIELKVISTGPNLHQSGHSSRFDDITIYHVMVWYGSVMTSEPCGVIPI
jgi:hypothetical protein